MNRRHFIANAALGTAALALPKLGFLDDSDLNPIWAQIQKQHDESVQRLQQWIRQPSIAAENRGMTEGCELTMHMLRDAGFDHVTKVPPTVSPESSQRSMPARRGLWVSISCTT